jgi:endonuclease YncB( thermonuclease family)
MDGPTKSKLRLMRVGLSAIAGFLLFAVSPASAGAAEQIFSGIGHAKDGDSLTVGDREVRLFGIDAPEWDQTCKRDGREWACGQVAAEELAKLVTGKDVSCVPVNIDQYNRTVAQCTVNDLDVNRAMVALGYAIAYRHYSTAYVSAEESAKVSRRGIWAGTFEMPSLYRRDERGEPSRNSSRRPHVRFASGNVQPAGPSRACNIKGNRGSHGWIYHLPGMPYYDRTNPEEWFCTEAQAQAAGYRRARAR